MIIENKVLTPLPSLTTVETDYDDVICAKYQARHEGKRAFVSEHMLNGKKIYIIRVRSIRNKTASKAAKIMPEVHSWKKGLNSAVFED